MRYKQFRPGPMSDENERVIGGIILLLLTVIAIVVAFGGCVVQPPTAVIVCVAEDSVSVVNGVVTYVGGCIDSLPF